MTIEQVKVEPRGLDIPDHIHKYLNEIAALYPEGIAGCAIVMWGFDCKSVRATSVHKDNIITPTLLPSFVAETLRRDIAYSEAVDAINDKIDK